VLEWPELDHPRHIVGARGNDQQSYGCADIFDTPGAEPSAAPELDDIQMRFVASDLANHPGVYRIRGVGRRRRDHGDMDVVLGVAVIAASVAGLAGPVMLVVRVMRSRQRRSEEMTAIAARADDQHQAVLRGDEQWGVFGQKPPMPPGGNRYAPIMPRPSTPRKPDQKWVIAGCAIAAGVMLFEAFTTMDARSADRLAGPRPAPRVTDTGMPMAPTHHAMPAPAPYAPGHLAPSLPFPWIPFPFPFPSTTVAPGPPTGVPAKIGQQAADGQFVFVVTSFDRSKTVKNPVSSYLQVTANGIFVNAYVTITNTGTQPQVFFAANQKLMVNGVVFNIDAAAALFTLTTAVGVSPGASVPVALSFDVPTDTPPGGTLKLHESSMSRGVDVALLPQ
jgi:Domain of unknown function (DUF4352)